MNVPVASATPIATSGGSINFKALIITVLIAIIVAILVSKATKNEVILRDANGNVVAMGDIKTTLRKAA